MPNHTDTCPQCLRRRNQPIREARSGSQTRAAYRCRRCRHTWTTDWTR